MPMPFPSNSIAGRFRWSHTKRRQTPTVGPGVSPHQAGGGLAIPATQLKQILLPKAAPDSGRKTDQTSSQEQHACRLGNRGHGSGSGRIEVLGTVVNTTRD